jgi:hypothetical protein
MLKISGMMKEHERKGGILLAGRRKILNDITVAEGKKNSNRRRMLGNYRGIGGYRTP